MSKLCTFTAEQDATIIRMRSEGFGRGDIARAIGKEPKQVTRRYEYLNPKPQPKDIEPHVGWPIPDARKLNDWGPGFYGQDVKTRQSTPKMLQPPLNHTVGGVGHGYGR